MCDWDSNPYQLLQQHHDWNAKSTWNTYFGDQVQHNWKRRQGLRVKRPMFVRARVTLCLQLDDNLDFNWLKTGHISRVDLLHWQPVLYRRKREPRCGKCVRAFDFIYMMRAASVFTSISCGYTSHRLRIQISVYNYIEGNQGFNLPLPQRRNDEAWMQVAPISLVPFLVPFSSATFIDHSG